MIDIIIPAYNAHETIKKTLLSIMMQVNINEIKVYIIDDFSDCGYEEEYNIFKDKMNIELYRLEKNMGPGYARQIGIEKSNSEYLLFIDSDDYIHNIFSIKNLYEKALETQCDIVIGDLEEINGDEIYTYTVGFDILHSKLYSRQFILNNNISFPYMYNSEDLSFNNLAIMCNPHIEYVDDIIYVYKRRENSLTMDDSYYKNRHIKYYSKNLIWTIEKAEKNNYDSYEIAKIIISSFAYLYYYFYNNFEAKDMKYVYKLVPFYQRYEKYIDEESKLELVGFWIERFEQIPLEISFEDFVSMCINKYKSTHVKDL